MSNWEIAKYNDESTPRSWVEYKGLHCICEPYERVKGKFAYYAITSEGNWIDENYSLIIINEYWTNFDFKGCETLEEAQKICLQSVDRYILGEIKPNFIKRRQDVRGGGKNKSSRRRKRN